MKKAYEAPDFEKVSFSFRDQVTASGSGSGCYTVTYNIHQRPETGRGDYRIQVDAKHAASHTCSQQTLTMSFNLPVTNIRSIGNLISGDGTNCIQIGLSYWQNGTDNIGMGDVIVEADQGLAVTGASMVDNGAN